MRYCLIGSAVAVLGLMLLHQGWRSPLMRTLGHSLMAIFYTFLLICGVLGYAKVGGFLRWRGLLFMGSISYGLYLLHHPVRGALFAMTTGEEPHVSDLQSFLLTMLAAALTIGIAYLSLRFFETPMLKVGQRWRYSTAPKAQSAIALPGTAVPAQ